MHILGDVKLAPDDIFYTCNGRLFGKVKRAVHIAVVGHGHGIYTVFLAVLYKIVDFACTVEQRILGVKVQMNEISHLNSSVKRGTAACKLFMWVRIFSGCGQRCL